MFKLLLLLVVLSLPVQADTLYRLNCDEFIFFQKDRNKLIVIKPKNIIEFTYSETNEEMFIRTKKTFYFITKIKQNEFRNFLTMYIDECGKS